MRTRFIKLTNFRMLQRNKCKRTIKNECASLVSLLSWALRIVA